MKYVKKPEDVKYRIVSLTSIQEGNYVSFAGGEVEYPKGAVLEVLKTDGTSQLEYDDERMDIRYGSYGNKFYIPHTMPTARLWVRAVSGRGVWYKVPIKLETEDERAYMMLASGTAQAELCGDAYFEAVYRLIRT